MEVLYGKYNEEQRYQLKCYADEYGLLPGAGSDSHGRQEQEMVSFPYEIYENLKKKKEELDRKLCSSDSAASSVRMRNI